MLWAAGERKYPTELREHSVRLIAEAMVEDSSLSLNAAVKRVGVVADTLRGWVKQHRIDFGQQSNCSLRVVSFSAGR